MDTEQLTITEMLRKALGAQRAGIVAYLRRHEGMQVREMVRAIEGALDLEPVRLEPVTGPDPRD
jgi:hypothetical protein